MKALLVSPLPPPVGGDSTWTVKYMDYCTNYGYPSSVVNTAVIGKRATNVEEGGSFLEELKRALKIWKNILASVYRFKPDIVHMNTNCSPNGIVRDYLSSVILGICRVPFVVHCRCNVQDQLGEGRMARYFFKKLVNQSRAIIALNDKSKNFIDRNTDKKAFIIPNFIDSQFVKAEKKTISTTIETLAFVGHIKLAKGIDEIITVAKSFPEKSFILIGPITREIEEKRVTANVIMLGNQNPEQIKAHLDKSDVFLFPSYTEGFANALLEAMARGLPCIATDVGANRDMLEDKGGIILPPRDSQSIIAAIRTLENQAIRRDMSEWNIRKVKTNYLIDIVFEKLQKLYIQVRQ